MHLACLLQIPEPNHFSNHRLPAAGVIRPLQFSEAQRVPQSTCLLRGGDSRRQPYWVKPGVPASSVLLCGAISGIKRTHRRTLLALTS